MYNSATTSPPPVKNSTRWLNKDLFRYGYCYRRGRPCHVFLRDNGEFNDTLQKLLDMLVKVLRQ